ncbi:MAG: 6-phosphofructokinase [Candidatus Omnitrophica bacterium]|nr:6-phosphofructokinase [Candidatus Omnitrophota bacterium]
MKIKRIGLLTAGGDAPGMNSAIRSVVRYALYHKLEVIGFYRGYWGLINEELTVLDHRAVSGIINLGGTILKTMRCQEFKTRKGQERAYHIIKKNALDALIVIGGDGTIRGAYEFTKRFSLPCVCIAASVDNDINGIDQTIGYDTAVNTALSAIDNIRDTATSMERIFVVEVMGRDSGFIALQVALAGGCENVIIPEKKFDLDIICHNIVEGNLRGKLSWIIVVAEGAASAREVADAITEKTSLETRVVVLGHIQRGGRPTATSRFLGTLFGKYAVEILLNGQSNKVVGMSLGKVVAVDFETALKKKEIPVDEIYHLINILT